MSVAAGFYGKLPAYGDFVRRDLPNGFVRDWDAWLQDGMAQARARLGVDWEAAWDHAPAWRFSLPAGACGAIPVHGLLLPSRDAVGRRFPLTIAIFAAPDPAWFEAAEAPAHEAVAGALDADALQLALAALPQGAGEVAPGWLSATLHWDIQVLPPASLFHLLLEGEPA
jgi:type VI secretion system protein ImpM